MSKTKQSNKPEDSLLNASKKVKRTQRSCLYRCGIISAVVVVGFLLLAFLLIFVGFPVYLMNSKEMQRSLIFVPYYAPAKDFLKIDQYANGIRNFYVTVSEADNITLGAWHFLPHALVNESVGNENFDYKQALLQANYPVVLHFHGNGGNRRYNLPMLLKLRQFFHVIAFDYRGYGDSTTAELSEEGIVEDSVELYKRLLSQIAPNKIYVWGHSLGSALATHTLARLRNEDIIPMGLILEAPFTNLREAIENLFLAKIFSWLPWFNATVLHGFEKNGFHFKTTENILKVDCPIMILHAEDDTLLPSAFSEKLAAIAQQKRDASTQGQTVLHLFPAKFKYNHWGITKAPELSAYVRDFLKICRVHYEKENSDIKNR